MLLSLHLYNKHYMQLHLFIYTQASSNGQKYNENMHTVLLMSSQSGLVILNVTTIERSQIALGDLEQHQPWLCLFKVPVVSLSCKTIKTNVCSNLADKYYLCCVVAFSLENLLIAAANFELKIIFAISCRKNASRLYIYIYIQNDILAGTRFSLVFGY